MTPDEFAKEHGHPPVAHNVVCIDFDGTIAPFGDTIFGFPKPLPGAKKFIDWLKGEGYTVVVFTSRLSTVWHASEGRDPGRGIFEQVEYLRRYFEKYDIDVDHVTAEKIPAMAYIDDKAIEFKNWRTANSRFVQRTPKRVMPKREDSE